MQKSSLQLRVILAQVVFAMGAMSMSSCAAQLAASSSARLQESVTAYNDAYKWKNYERAVEYIPRDLRAPFLALNEDEDASLHVEEYQIVAVDVLDEKTADVTVKVRFILLPSVSVDRAVLVQHWREINGSWILETEDNSIRTLDLAAKPKNPDAFGGSE